MLTRMYDFAAENLDCLYHPTCEKCFYRNFGKHRESEDVSPHKLGLRKIAFELRLGFENIEMYTLKHYGSITLIFSLLWGNICVITRQSKLKYQGDYSLFHN